VYIFPGIPQLLRKKFVALEKLFNEPVIRVRKVYLNTSESRIAPLLNEIVSTHQNVKIGSYPVLDNDDYALMITMESLNGSALDTAVQSLIERVSREVLVRVEG